VASDVRLKPDYSPQVGIGCANLQIATDSGGTRQKGRFPNPVCAHLLVRQGSCARNAPLAYVVRCRRTTRIHLLATLSPSPCRTVSGYRLW
jgi:hypothetical protein